MRGRTRLIAVGLIASAVVLGGVSNAGASAIGSTIASKLSVSNFQHYLDDLLQTHNGMSRGIGGAQHDICRGNIQTTMQSFGLNVVLAPFTYNAATYYNVVATKTGWQFPNSYYIIGAHYDSVNNPGADDDGTGVAAIMEIARILATYDTRYSIRFIAWDREEQGKIGSTAWVSQNAGATIPGMVQLDMIGHDTGLNRQNVYSNAASTPLKNALISAIGTYGNGLTVGDAGPATFSDHAPFNSAGYQAICFVENAYTQFGCYHQQCDSVDTANYIHYAFATNLARSVAGWLADVAGASKKGDVTGNGIVDIDDLVAVITSWGNCPAAPTPCPADIPPTPGAAGNGAVDIDDLVAVIVNWG